MCIKEKNSYDLVGFSKRYLVGMEIENLGYFNGYFIINVIIFLL